MTPTPLEFARAFEKLKADLSRLPEPDLRLRKGDEVVIVTHQKHLEDLRSRWEAKPGGRRH